MHSATATNWYRQGAIHSLCRQNWIIAKRHHHHHHQCQKPILASWRLAHETVVALADGIPSTCSLCNTRRRHFSSSLVPPTPLQSPTKRPSLEASNSGSADGNNPAAVDGVPSVRTVEPAAAAAADLLLDPVTSTTVGALSRPMAPRPIFPWRHEPLEHPLPRLTPGTSEFEADAPMQPSNWTQRLIAYWFLGVPLSTTLPLLPFNDWRAWESQLADGCAFSFARAVSGIVANVYQIPYQSVLVVKNDQDNADNADDDMRVVFQFPSKDFPDVPETSEIVTPVGTADEMKVASDSDGTIQTPVETTLKGAADPVDSAAESGTSSNNPMSAHPAFGGAPIPYPSSLGGGGDDVSVNTSLNNDTTSINDTKTELVNNTDTNGPIADTKEQSDDLFCSQIKDMMIAPLRELFESAHKSGKDQLIIQLHMEPIRALCYSIRAAPYVTRAETAKNPDKLQKMRNLRRLAPTDAFRTIFKLLERDLARSGRLESTVEVQVLVLCNESFQVRDRASGMVVQGTEDGAVRGVAHLVRLECTAINEMSESDTQDYHTDWQITDIDDLLGPTAWYQQ